MTLHLRAKLGFCNCTTGVADDDDLDRMGDTVLLGEASPLGSGRPISVAWMKGRSRAYLLNSGGAFGKAVVSVVYNERCDMIAATAVIEHERNLLSLREDLPDELKPLINKAPIIHQANAGEVCS